MAEQESSVVIVSNENETEQPAETTQEPEQEKTTPVEDKAPEPEADDDEQDGDDHKSRLQERFKKLTSQREEARQEALAAKQRAADLEARLAAIEKPQQTAKAQDAKPQPADFTDAFEYAEHLAEWAAQQAILARDAEDRKKAEDTAKAKVVDGWRERLAAVKTELPDFDEAITASDVVVSDAVRDAIIESEAGPRILYHLAEHPELAKSIAEMTTAASLRAIGRLEAKFEKRSVSDEPPATKPKTSKAPAPITPIRSSSTIADAVTSDGDFNGSYEDYKRLRSAGKIR